jgi:hypothetical protein
MRTRFWKTPLAFIVVFGLLAVPAASEAGQRARVRARSSEQNPGVQRNQPDNPGPGRRGARIYQD